MVRIPRTPLKSALNSYTFSRTPIASTGTRRSLTLSAVEGPATPPLETRPLYQFFKEDIIDKHGSRPAFICREERPRSHGGPVSRNLGVQTHLAWDFDEFDRHIGAAARGLLAMAVKKGDRVAVIMGNHSVYATLQWACASIGAILVTINPAYRLHELVTNLNTAGVNHLFIVPRLRKSQYLNGLAGQFPDLKNSRPGDIQEPAIPTLRNLVVANNFPDEQAFAKELDNVKSAVDWREIMMWREDGRERKEVEEIGKTLHTDEVINLQFTSGTTGAPKAVSLTHMNVLNNGLSIGRCMNLGPTDVLCNVPPLFHCFDKSGNLAAWSHASCIVYPSETFCAPSIVDAVVNEKCTALHGVPTHFIGVLAELEKRIAAGERPDTRNLRTGIAAGSPIPIDLMRELIDKLNLTELTIAYGMTETSPVSFQTVAADPINKRVETVGKVQPHVKAKVVDKEGNVAPVNTPGELHIAGYLVHKGYWNDQEQTDKVMKRDAEGTLWMHTGDEAIMDDEGYLKIVGRIKDIIIRGGENLFPVQIENATTAHPLIREAAAIAVPDTKYGEVVGVWVAPHPGAQLSREDVRRQVAGSMNPQNAPSWVWFLGEDGTPEELPKTASGKVQKHILRAWSKELAVKGIGKV
ncbi:acetyl-CoA synthetase-like protein [Coniophora puteana RWD-64-598 SS2]|uniref:Acetyl-CoA synthetase-like protein n=1 Tax=Coniophora puteana (strain RWD-64-598) TaxID=741705 RepID=A0A5M3ME02_CONPW|nr:acetyl-CoA synthetase-like protein [Coniophora puteana RWD-64-598 SS2]EIW77226.1 acetyl-CoA synthetase-like protein [Coniophora puteana RWD-64-598 SS2]